MFVKVQLLCDFHKHNHYTPNRVHEVVQSPKEHDMVCVFHQICGVSDDTH